MFGIPGLQKCPSKDLGGFGKNITTKMVFDMMVFHVSTVQFLVGLVVFFLNSDILLMVANPKNLDPCRKFVGLMAEKSHPNRS